MRGQIEGQREQFNPIGFSFPDGSKGRVWLTSDRHGAKLIGDDRHWRVNVADLLKLEKENTDNVILSRYLNLPSGFSCIRNRPTIPWRPLAETLRRPVIAVGRNEPVRDVDDALQTVKGFKVLAEKELQVLGCGWRIITCQFRSNKVLLHHNGNVATMKRKAFKDLLAAVRIARRKRHRPSLRLVVSNPKLSVTNALAA